MWRRNSTSPMTRSACCTTMSTTCRSDQPSSATTSRPIAAPTYWRLPDTMRAGEWVERYGDPRDPNVDPIDWVERIPFSETRNYVQRILENLQVYRVRFGGSTKLLIEADLRRGGATISAASPAP